MEDLQVVNSPINEEMDDSLINQLLVDPCLEHIFTFLPIMERIKVEGVCRRWRTVGKRGWNDTKTLEIEEEDSDDMIHLVLQRCGRFLRQLVINVASNHPHCLTEIMEFCKLDQLEDIQIIFNDVSSAGDSIRHLREIFQRARKLVAVSILSGRIVYPTDCLNHLNPEILQRLHLSHHLDWEEIYNERLSINPDRFPNLKELLLMYMHITRDEMKREEEGSLKGLETLSLHKCDIPQLFIERIKTFRNLRELTLEENICDLRNNHFRSIAEYCDRIVKLQLTYCSNVTSACFEYLGRMPSLKTFQWESNDTMNISNFMYLENVEHLILFIYQEFCNEHELIEIIVKLSNLGELTLWFYDGVNKALMNDIRRIFHRGRRQKHLHLRIKDFDIHWSELEVSDHPLLTIVHTDVD